MRVPKSPIADFLVEGGVADGGVDFTAGLGICGNAGDALPVDPREEMPLIDG